MHTIIHHPHIYHIIISCHIINTVLARSTNTYTTQNNGKRSLQHHISAKYITQPKQPKTAQQQFRKIPTLPIRVLSMPYAYCPNLANSIRVMPTLLRVLSISSPNPYAYHLSHTRMLRVTIPHYAYQQRPKHVQNIIFLIHTRIA